MAKRLTFVLDEQDAIDLKKQAAELQLTLSQLLAEFIGFKRSFDIVANSGSMMPKLMLDRTSGRYRFEDSDPLSGTNFTYGDENFYRYVRQASEEVLRQEGKK